MGKNLNGTLKPLIRYGATTLSTVGVVVGCFSIPKEADIGVTVLNIRSLMFIYQGVIETSVSDRPESRRDMALQCKCQGAYGR